METHPDAQVLVKLDHPLQLHLQHIKEYMRIKEPGRTIGSKALEKICIDAARAPFSKEAPSVDKPTEALRQYQRGCIAETLLYFPQALIPKHPKV